MATDIFYNGHFIGETDNSQAFIQNLKEKRRNNEFPRELNVRYDSLVDTILLTTDIGRALRPLIIVKDGKSMLTQEVIDKVLSEKMSWDDLVENKIIEYVDASEEDNLFIAMFEKDLTKDHTHLEIDPIAMFGLVTSLVPFANHDQSSRLARGSKTQKQSLGLYAANYPNLIDTDVSVLHYPQKPIVRSFVYDYANFYPAGQNVIVAVMPYEGYNMSDALVINKGSLDRGLARSTYFRPYSSIELFYTGNLSDEICIPEKDTTGYRTEKKYRFLEDDGIVYPEADLSEEDVLIGKVSPPKFMLDMEEISLAKSKKENSTSIKQGEKGVVDGVFITTDEEGRKIAQIRVRDTRIPEIGDKFATPHGQKGILGFIANEEDIPFTSRGIKPDLIFNPHGLPSRMTVSYLMELLSGKAGAASGKIVDGTAFSINNTEELEKSLFDLGFREDGKEMVYDPITGKPLEARIFIGSMYYLRLKYMVANKIQVRAAGKITLLTRQPVEGRAKGGALRLGEMEKDALVSHGASLLLKERFSSDNITLYICPQCGSIGIHDRLKNKDVCPLCDNQKLEPVEISYASKLLFEELISMHLFPRFNLKNKFDDN